MVDGGSVLAMSAGRALQATLLRLEGGLTDWALRLVSAFHSEERR